MARNEEKAQSMLYRFREAKNAELGIRSTPDRRPRLASECNNLGDAERWRQQVIRDVSRKVSKIQDAGLSDYQVRDLNDEINKLMREKNHWERRILELGGPDYFRIGPKMLDHQGKEVPGNRGYKYFGRARDLPGVRELFEQAAPEAEKRTRGDLYKHVDADYYGYRDEEDGVLLAYEKEQEAALIRRLLGGRKLPITSSEDFGPKSRNRKRKAAAANDDDDDDGGGEPGGGDIERDENGEEGQDEHMEIDGAEGDGDETSSGRPRFVSHFDVPSQKEVEAFLIRRRKREMLDKYTEDDT